LKGEVTIFWGGELSCSYPCVRGRPSVNGKDGTSSPTDKEKEEARSSDTRIRNERGKEKNEANSRQMRRELHHGKKKPPGGNDDINCDFFGKREQRKARGVIHNQAPFTPVPQQFKTGKKNKYRRGQGRINT